MDLETLRKVARREADVFGGRAKVTRFHHEDRKDLHVEILSAVGSPEPGLTSFGTIGMSTFDSGKVTPTGPLRVELVGPAQDRRTAMANGLATCAFNVGTGQFGIKPEAVYPGVFAGYQDEVTTPHALFWDPDLWSQSFGVIEECTVTITWLMAIPITESEFGFSQERGVSAFMDEVERLTPDTYDMGRPGIV